MNREQMIYRLEKVLRNATLTCDAKMLDEVIEGLKDTIVLVEPFDPLKDPCREEVFYGGSRAEGKIKTLETHLKAQSKLLDEYEEREIEMRTAMFDGAYEAGRQQGYEDGKLNSAGFIDDQTKQLMEKDKEINRLKNVARQSSDMAGEYISNQSKKIIEQSREIERLKNIIGNTTVSYAQGFKNGKECKRDKMMAFLHNDDN